MFARVLILIMLAAGCDADLKIATSGLGVKDFKAENVAFDRTAETLTVTWNNSSALESATVILATKSDCTGKAAVIDQASGDSVSLSQIPDGVYYVCVSSEKNGQRYEAMNNGTLNFTLDRNAPVIEQMADLVTNTQVLLAPTIDDLTQVTAVWEVVSGPAPVKLQQSAHALAATFTTDGTYTFQITATDESGKTSTRTVNVTFDTVSPTVDAGIDRNVNALFTQTAIINADAKTIAWSKVSGPGDVLFGSVDAATTTIAASMDGTYIIRATVTDAAGNSAFDELTLVWDVTPPTFTSLNGVNGANDGYLNASEIASTDAMFTLNAADYTTVAYTDVLANAGLTCDSGQSYGNAAIPLINTTPAADADYAICVKLTDDVGNTTYQKSQVITRDIVAPTVDVGADIFTNATTTINATTADAATYAWTQQSGTGTITFGTPTAEDTTVSASAEDTYTLRLTATDAAGNSAYEELNFTWDTTAPTFTSLAVAGDAVDGYVNFAEKDNGTALWTITAANYVAAAYTEPLDNTVAVTCDPSKSYSTGAISSASSLLADKPYVICVKLTDASGNITYGTSAVVTRDTGYPTFTSLIGANGASDGTINASEESSTAALLTLDASGQTSTKYTAVLADSALTCNVSKTYSTSTIPAINTIPAADGAYAVCVELKDAAGNTTYGKSQQIVRDVTAPTVDVGVDLSVNATATINASTGGTPVSYAWSQEAGPGTITFGTPTAEDTTAATSTEGTYTLRLTVTDAAGNTNFDELTFVWDVTPPTLTSLNGANGASNGYLNASEIASTAAMFTLNASNYTTAAYTDVLANAGLTCDSGQSYGNAAIPLINTTPAADVDYAICVRLNDAAGNTTYGKSQVITRDIVAPTVDVGADLNVNATVTINATTGGTPVSYAWSKQSGPGTITFGTPTAEDTTAATSTEGTYTLRLTVTDAAGNTNFDELTFVWDVTPPTLTSLNGANGASNGYLNASEVASTAVMFTLNASNYTTVAYTAVLANASLTCDSGKTYGNASIPLINATPATDAAYAVCVRLNDAAGNTTYGKSQVITRDVVAPTVNVGGDVSAKASYSLNATTSGALTYAWTKQSGPGTITFGTASAEDTTVSAGTDGAYVLRLTVTDAAGNSSFDELNFTWDSTPPTFMSLNGANEASDGYINASETSSGLAAFTLSAANYISATYTAFLLSTATCNGTQTYSSGSIPRINTISGTDGSYVICVKLVDNVTNITYGKSQTIVRDAAAPTVNVGSDVSAKASYSLNATTSGALTFAWTKQSGPGTITFGTASAEDTTVSAGTDGVYVLRLTVTDAAGNSSFDELNFTWDNTPPTVNVGADVDTTQIFTRSATVSGATTYLWSVVAGDSSKIVFGSPTSATTSILAMDAGYYTIRLTATDAAGNSAYDDLKLTWGVKDYLIFVTSTAYNGQQMGGIATADSHCATHAAAGNLPGSYVAIISDSSTDAINRFTATSKIRNMLHEPVANNAADLWDGSVKAPANYTELLGANSAFTGTLVTGLRSANNCTNWTVTSGSGSMGVTALQGGWINYGNHVCFQGGGVMCISTTAAVPSTQLEAVTGTGNGNIDLSYKLPSNVTGLSRVELRRVMGATAPADCTSGSLVHTWNTGIAANATLTRTDNTGAGATLYSYRACEYSSTALIASYPAVKSVYSGSTTVHKLFVTNAGTSGALGGLTGADTFCQNAANAVSLAGTYKAILSTTAVSANNRLTISGNVKRTDGVLLAGNSADFWDGALMADPGVNESGTYTGAGVFSSTDPAGNTKGGGQNCLDWTSSNSTDNGAVARSHELGSTWISHAAWTSCNQGRSIYCISQ